jgi:hypothetical protein
MKKALMPRIGLRCARAIARDRWLFELRRRGSLNEAVRAEIAGLWVESLC